MDLKPDGRKMAEKVLEPLDSKVNRRAKDSVFVDLFEQPEYLIQLYRALHPEDTEAREDDLTIVTLESLMLRERYNDLGFLISNRLVILVEAQSTWSVNIVVRFLLYVADTYNRYIEKNDLDLYSSRRVELPHPELYVIYTGSRVNCPDDITLTRDILDVFDCDIEVRARVIRSSTPGDIIDQYIAYTRVFDEQMRIYGGTRKAVEETLRICRDKNILHDYLKKEEVADIMFTLIDRDKQIERMLRREREENQALGRAEGMAQGRAEGMAQGRAEGMAQGRAEGMAQGLEEGRAQEREDSDAIIRFLLAHNRYDDLERVTRDEEFRKQILEEISAANK